MAYKFKVEMQKPSVLVPRYYDDTAGKNAKKIAEHLQNQLKKNRLRIR
jgi:hypothetical protein